MGREMPLSSSTRGRSRARAAELFNGTEPGRYAPQRYVCGALWLGEAAHLVPHWVA